MVFTTAALLALPMQPGARADTGAKIVEEVDFATSCSAAVQHTIFARFTSRTQERPLRWAARGPGFFY